jgi:hypothetical protein
MDKARKLLMKGNSMDVKPYARLRALIKLSEDADLPSLGYDSKVDSNLKSGKNIKAKISKIVTGTEEVGKSPTESGGKWKELKLLARAIKTPEMESSIYKSIGISPTDFKNYFRDAETGRNQESKKSEQSKKAMPFSAKSMIQKYLKSKMES